MILLNKQTLPIDSTSNETRYSTESDLSTLPESKSSGSSPNNSSNWCQKLRTIKHWFTNKSINPTILLPNDILPDTGSGDPSYRQIIRSVSYFQFPGRFNRKPSFQSLNNCTDHEDYTCIGTYRIIKTIGIGSFSEVKLAIDVFTDESVAIKFISKENITNNQSFKNSVDNEVSLLKNLNHPNIVKFIKEFETLEYYCISMEYINSGELFDQIAYHFDQMIPQRSKKIFRQLVSVVEYLHSQFICHRDLKLENILIDELDNIKLTDFGFAKRFEKDQRLTCRCGSDEYIAPEIILSKPYDGRKVDIWAMGVILFTLLTGEFPFYSQPNDKPHAMYHRIARGQFKFPQDRKNSKFTHLDENARSLVKKILQPIEKNRATLEDIKSHIWLA